MTRESGSSPSSQQNANQQNDSGLKRFLRKLPPLWFGSDVYERYTAAYTWYANQLGHFALGFLGSHIVIWLAPLLIALLGWVGPALTINPFNLAIGIVALLIVLYVLKEIADYLIAVHLSGGVFPVEPREVMLDGIADTYFVAIGAVLALVSHESWGWAVVIFIIGLAIAYAFKARYLPGKTAFDRSGLPFYYRLPNFHGQVDPENVDRVLNFAKGEKAPQHLVIYGARGTGKTTLATGIGCRLTVEEKQVRYITAFKLFEEMAAGTALASGGSKASSNEPWRLDEAEYLIVDDVDTDIVGPAKFLIGQPPEELLDALGSDMLALLRRINTVWVFGTSGRLEAWRQALAKALGAEPGDLVAIELTRRLDS